jgi:O-antigen/teichoic acid export membrane protein
MANVLRQIINIGSEILLVPILLTCWGAGLYGEWQILSAAVAYFAILDLGTHTYASNRLNECYNTGKLAELNRNLHSALTVAVLAAGVGLMFAIPAAVIAPVGRWFHLDQTSQATASLVLIALAIQAALALPIAMLGGIYRAVGEYARDIMVNNLYRVVTCLLTAVIALAGGGIEYVAAIQLLAFAGAMLYIIIDVWRRHPQIHIGLRQTEARLVVSFIAPSLLFLLIQLSASAVVQGTVLIVGAAAGATAVAVFTTLRTLVNGVPQVVNSISSTLWPELTAMNARGERQSLRELHQLGAKVMLWLGLAAAVFLHYASADIVSLWIGTRIQFDQHLIDALLVLELLTTWTLASSTLIAASNRPRTLAVAQLISTAFGLGLGFWLAQQWGSQGVVWGLVFSAVAITAWYIPYAACQMLDDRFGRFMSEVFLKGSVLLVSLYLIVGLLKPLLAGQPQLMRVFVIWSISGIVGLVLLFGLWLNSHERQWLRLFLPSWLSRSAVQESSLAA